MPEKDVALKGVCFFHFETGTEGGYWAFQDNQFIIKNVSQPYCQKCGKYLDPSKYENLAELQKVVMNSSRAIGMNRNIA